MWFTNFPESEGGFDTFDEDVGRAVADLRRLSGAAVAQGGRREWEGEGAEVTSAVVLALASVMSLIAGIKMIVLRTCSPLKAVHRRDLTPDAERRLALVCGPALLVVGVSFAASAWLAAFAGDAARGPQAAIGAVGVALPALVILLAVRRYGGSAAS